MLKVISFEEAVHHSNQYAKHHLLLGNGFSIACIPSIFTYDSLYNQADFSSMPEAKKVFEILYTQDFELIINALENSSLLIPVYNLKSTDTAKKMCEHAQLLKEILIQTLAKNHPAYPATIEDNKYKSCLKFLSIFLDSESCIYTLNYDLLLYWTLMYGVGEKLIQTIPSDGFGRDVDFEDGEVSVSDYLAWQCDSKAHHQNVHYLHGALHIYDRGHYTEKFTWIDTGITLIEQARKALSENRFPLFVSEGASNKKMEKITHSGYLYHSFKSFSANMKKVGFKTAKNCLFTYGVSFSENDSHILKKIAQGKVAHLFISIYGNPDTTGNKQIIASAEKLKYKRGNNDLTITYYDAESAKVWG